MRPRLKTIAAAAAIVLLSLPRPAVASVVIEARVHINLAPTCPAVDGFYQTLTPDASSPLTAISWSGDKDIRLTTNGPLPLPDATYRFRLIGPDRLTVLFEGAFQRARGEHGPTEHWELQTTLDCTTVPYQPVGQRLPQETASPSAALVGLGAVALLAVALMAFWRRSP